MQITQTKLLFVVVARPQQCAPSRPLTLEDRVRGWSDREDRGCGAHVVNEGHEAGRLHSLATSHVLTWEPNPGDEIGLTVRVVFTYDYTSDGRAAIKAEIASPFLHGVHLGNGVTIWPSVKTNLGRQVSLGEDAAEYAFGADAVAEQCRRALEEDWSSSTATLEFSVGGRRSKNKNALGEVYASGAVFTEEELAAIVEPRLTPEEWTTHCDALTVIVTD